VNRVIWQAAERSRRAPVAGAHKVAISLAAEIVTDRMAVRSFTGSPGTTYRNEK
jgi:hypothetical protein